MGISVLWLCWDDVLIAVDSERSVPTFNDALYYKGGTLLAMLRTLEFFLIRPKRLSFLSTSVVCDDWFKSSCSVKLAPALW